MRYARSKSVDVTKILTRSEIATVLADLKRKVPRSQNTGKNLIVFRLACCCGLRASEIAHLQIGDVRVDQARPHLRIRKAAAKGGKARTVPLWWDGGTLEDLRTWHRGRLEMANVSSPLIASSLPDRDSMPLSRHTLRKRFRTACKVLGKNRLATLTIHHGRHTFISHSLAGGRTLAEVRDAAGHANVSVTSRYLHARVDDDEEVKNLFGEATAT